MGSRKKAPSAERDPLIEEFQDELPVPLRTDELVAKSDERQREAKGFEAIDAELAKAKELHKEKTATLQGKLRKLDDTLEAHAEKRMIVCERVFNLETNEVLVRVKETQVQLGKSRSMTATEREEILEKAQAKIPGMEQDQLPGSDTEKPEEPE